MGKGGFSGGFERERAREPEPRRSHPFSPSQPGRATLNKTGSRKKCSRNLFCKAPSFLPQIHAVPSGQSPPHCLYSFRNTPATKNTTASGKRQGKVSQEFNLCLFSCTSKAFLVLLFKASRHSRNPSCCWGSAHEDPVGWAFQPFNQCLAQIQSKRKTHSVGSPLQLCPSGGCCGFLQRASKEPAPSSHPPLVGPQQQALPPQRSRGEIPQHPGCSQSATPHAPTLLGANSRAPSEEQRKK